jgi:hypothetical protein
LKKAFLPLAALVLLAAACTSPTSSAGASSDVPSLGDYKISEVGARDVPGQPYGTKVAAALTRRQLYFDGLRNYVTGSDLPQLVDYEAGKATVKYSGSNSGWTGSPHVSIPARLRGNGRESIVSVVFEPKALPFKTGANQGSVRLEIWDGATLTTCSPFEGKSGENFMLYICGWSEPGGNIFRQLNNELSAAAGDLSGDGVDEIGFCVGNRFVIVDGSRPSTVLYDGWATGSGSEDADTLTMHPSRVAAGDIKGDGSVAFVTTYGSAKANAVGSYRIYGGAVPRLLASGSLGGGSCPLSLLYANVCLGDLDGDGRKEVIFAGRQDLVSNPCNVVAADWDAAGSTLAFWSQGHTIPVAGTDWGYNPIPPLVAFDPNPRTEQSKSRPEVLLAWDNILVCNPDTRAFSQGYKSLSTIARPLNTNVCAADINYDNQDELVSLSSAGGVGFEVYSLGSGNSFSRTTISASLSGNYVSSCVADLRGQSVVLEYLGSAVKYTNPQLVAVLASPPYYAADAGNSAFGNTCTSFGKATSSGQANSNSFTVSAGVIFGVQGDMPLWGDTLAETDKVTISASFTYAFENEREATVSHAYATMAGKDAVIFACIPYDVYSYRILSAPNSAVVGTTMTVDMPREPQVIQMERGAFNAIPLNPISVGSSVLSHTIGDPRSYPNRQAIASACASGGMYDPTGIPSPVGDGQYSTDTVSVSDGKSTTVGGGVSVEASVEITVLGALFGVEAGFSDDFSYTVTTTRTTEISGSVPGILSGSGFTFGVAGYNVADTKIQPAPFMVVTYWVE